MIYESILEFTFLGLTGLQNWARAFPFFLWKLLRPFFPPSMAPVKSFEFFLFVKQICFTTYLRKPIY